MLTDHEHREFAKRFIQPEDWLAKSASAWTCANQIRIVYEAACYRSVQTGGFHFSQGTGPFYLMLCGNAMEAALKALLMQRSGAQFIGQDGMLIDSRVRALSHDLVELGKQMGDPITAADHDLLARLQEFVVWAGRYPYPKKAESLDRAITKTGPVGDWSWDWDNMTRKHGVIAELLGRICRTFPNGEQVRMALGLY